MNPCNCAGINVTWACNWKCKHCFYRRSDSLHKPLHRPLSDIIAEAKAGKERGCNRIVLIGQGEPMLHPEINKIIASLTELGLYSNIITNGSLPIGRYKELFYAGLNHLQISAHALDETLDVVTETPGAGEKQKELIEWLSFFKYPFRTNTSLQQLNYHHLLRTVFYLIEKGAFHVALLGFLPHYEWKQYAAEVAVHPKELRPYIEAAADLLIDSGTYFTIRYHPFCHLSPEYWKYIVNARYVLYDPWEWDYGFYNQDPDKVWPAAQAMGESVAIQGYPCTECCMKLHCGGWNKFYADTFQGAGLTPLVRVPFEAWPVRNTPGGLHDLNAANRLKGHCANGRPVQ